MGSPATATLVRRAARRAVGRVPELQGLEVKRQDFEYRYTLPASWNDDAQAGLEALRALSAELEIVLEELTGRVVLHRLGTLPELRDCGLFCEENES